MNLDQTVGHELVWRQPETFRRFYQLTCNGSELATVRFEKRSGLLATAECGQRKWTFRRTGFLATRVSIRQAGAETDLATFTPSWTDRGSLVLARDAVTNCCRRISGRRNGHSSPRVRVRWSLSPALMVSSSRAATPGQRHPPLHRPRHP